MVTSNRNFNDAKRAVTSPVNAFDDEFVTLAEEISPNLDDFIIEEDLFEYPTEDKVPHGYYYCEVKTMSPRLKNGKKILDVGYELIDEVGAVYNIKQSYPAGSVPMKTFYRAMIAAGAKPGSKVETAIGMLEVIKLEYTSKNSNFGTIAKRMPEAEFHAQNEAKRAKAEKASQSAPNYVYDDI